MPLTSPSFPRLIAVDNPPASRGPSKVLIVVSLALVSVSHLLPTFLGAPIALMGLGGGFLLWVQNGNYLSRRGYWAIIFAGLIILFWVLSLVNLNVPSINIGIDGIRKSAFAVAGVAWGCAVASSDRQWVERATIILLNTLLAGSIVTYFWFPQFTAGSSDAGIYTSLFQGQERLQGLFSGPFHVALAALICISWAVVRMSSDRLLAAVSLALGALAGYLCLVRTFYPALALILLVFVIVSPNASAALRRALTLVGVGVALLLTTFLFPNLSRLGDIASTIFNFETDERFTHRFRRYATSLDLIETSPVYGWGPGSAGDTLVFPTGFEHVTAHNIVLKLTVEGGLLGISLWAGLIVALLLSSKRGGAAMQLSTMGLAALFGLGLTVSAIDTLPVSFLLFVLCGLACETSAASRVESGRRVLKRPPALGGAMRTGPKG